ncbi:sigma-70 family RNA polymerase sigma factor [Streptomyces sp. NPDC048659]|uniref:RNA polymerase sigma factor n=1 Tax=Streptomyces sp. NPDC048659 TaxID=3155489 RepID=UPI00342DCFC3
MTDEPPGPTRCGTGPDDTLLVERAREGDEEAFETLVRRHAPTLLRLARRMLSDAAEAEDVVQDALVSAWRRLPDFRGDATFLTWMFKIVTNGCLNRLRARRPTMELDSVPEPPAPAHEGSPARAAESSAALADLTAALAELSPEQRACWILRELHLLSYEEVAEAVGISATAARGRIFRARRSLTEAMSEWR